MIRVNNATIRNKLANMLPAFILATQTAYADSACIGDANGLQAVLLNLYCSFADIANLLGGSAYLGGLAFGAAAAFKFKQHRDNPTQVTVGAPIIYLTIAVGLVFLPSLLMEGRATLFDSDDEVSPSYIGVNYDKIEKNPWAQ
ncbi:MAG: hypothetical protein VX112_03430 [Pseudomonadota bacterium]|nr:hypothetical protein [Pseudomonadota bacterium]